MMDPYVTESFFLSPQQKRIWLDQLENHAVCAWSQVVVRIADPLDENRLRSALDKAVSRHEILRTVFIRHPGMRVPFQSILECAEIDWEVRAIAQATSPDEDIAITAHRADQSRRSFDLEHGPLLRALLLCAGRDQSVLILTVPALCLDAYSLKNLAIEVMRSCRDEEPSPTEPIRYVQFSQWQNDLLESAGKDGSAAEAYWAESTRDVTAVNLPIAPDPESAGVDGYAAVGCALEAATLEQLEAMATRLGASLQTCLFAAWQILLWRMSGQAQLLTHVVFDGRQHEELSSIMGPMAKLLPIPSEVDAAFSFRAWVSKAQRALDQAAAWQEYLDPAAYRSAEPPCVFSYADERDERSEGYGYVGMYEGGERKGLRLECVRSAGGLRLGLGYGAGRYGRRGVERLLGYFAVLLGAAVGDGEQRVGDLPLLSDAEQGELFELWRGEEAEYPRAFGGGPDSRAGGADAGACGGAVWGVVSELCGAEP